MNKITLLIIISILPLNNLFPQAAIDEINSETENHFHYNNFAIFTGASSLFKKNETHFTLGADFIRNFSPESNFSAGIYTEAIFAHHTEWLFGAALFYWLTEHLWIRSGPGIEIKQEENEHTDEIESKTGFLIRIGAGYSIHFGKIFMDPSVDIDFLRSSTTLVWGVNFGIGF